MTTAPSRAGVLAVAAERPVSFDVPAGDFAEMERQAHEVASWGPNVYVRIPVTDVSGAFSGPLIGRLTKAGMRVNVTAVMTAEQVWRVAEVLTPGVRGFVSVFAGSVADTGQDPVPLVRRAVTILRHRPDAELIWAGPREPLNIFQADDTGCHVIAAGAELLGRLALVGKDLDVLSLETVRALRDEAVSAGLAIETPHLVG